MKRRSLTNLYAIQKVHSKSDVVEFTMIFHMFYSGKSMCEQGKPEPLPPAKKLELYVFRRSSSPVMLFTKGGVLINLAKFTGKH